MLAMIFMACSLDGAATRIPAPAPESSPLPSFSMETVLTITDESSALVYRFLGAGARSAVALLPRVPDHVASPVHLEVTAAQEGVPKTGASSLNPALGARHREAQARRQVFLTESVEVRQAQSLAVLLGEERHHRFEPGCHLGTDVGRRDLFGQVVREFARAPHSGTGPEVVEDRMAGDLKEPGLQFLILPEASQPGVDLGEDVLKDVLDIVLFPHAHGDEAAQPLAELRPDHVGRNLRHAEGHHTALAARTKALTNFPSTCGAI